MAGFFNSLIKKITNRADVDWDELEAHLIGSDIGIKMTTSILLELRELGRKISTDDVEDITRRHLLEKLPDDIEKLQPRPDGKPTVILVVGVNGVGKTTSVAKLGCHLQNRGFGCILAAADTFRAAAVEQLQRWGQRLSLNVMTGQANADPSSVCFNAHELGIRQNKDFVICDTAGRLHNRHNLMRELEKIRRTLAKQDPEAPHLTLLVIDATTGMNALQQAREFHKATPLDGLIVTKLDGSGKGGIILAIQQELGISPYFIGTGEEPTQFALFNRENFVKQVL